LEFLNALLNRDFFNRLLSRLPNKDFFTLLNREKLFEEEDYLKTMSNPPGTRDNL
jgi:hypothetical protein